MHDRHSRQGGASGSPDGDPIDRAGWRGPFHRALIEETPGGLNRIVYVRRPALADQRPAAPPLDLPFTPPPPKAPRRSRIPATAREVAARLGAEPPRKGRPAPWVSSGPLPSAAECLALRLEAGLTQRPAAEGAGVSRGLVAELEQPTRERRPEGSPAAERYVVWLLQQVRQRERGAAVEPSP